MCYWELLMEHIRNKNKLKIPLFHNTPPNQNPQKNKPPLAFSLAK